MPFDDPEKQARYEAWLASKKTQEQGYISSAAEYIPAAGQMIKSAVIGGPSRALAEFEEALSPEEKALKIRANQRSFEKRFGIDPGVAGVGKIAAQTGMGLAGGALAGAGLEALGLSRLGPLVARGGFGDVAIPGFLQRQAARTAAGAISGAAGAAATKPDPQSIGMGTAIGGALSSVGRALAAPLMKGVEFGEGLIDKAVGRSADVEAGSMLRALTSQETKERLATMPQGRVQDVAHPDDYAIQTAATESRKQLPGPYEKFDLDTLNQEKGVLSRMSGGATPEDASAARVAELNRLNDLTDPMRQRVERITNMAGTMPRLEIEAKRNWPVSSAPKLEKMKSLQLQPLNINPMTDYLDATAMSPGVRANPMKQELLQELSAKVKQLASYNNWTSGGDPFKTTQPGIIDFRDLYELRKAGINDVVSTLMAKRGAQATSEHAASLVGDAKKYIDEAIEKSLGVAGPMWRRYLNTYIQGRHRIDQMEFADALQRLHDKDPMQFVDVVRGKKPEMVDKYFGLSPTRLGKIRGKNDDINEMMAPHIADLRRIADRIERDAAQNMRSEKGRTLFAAAIQKQSGAWNTLVNIMASKTKTGEMARLLSHMQDVDPAVQKRFAKAMMDSKDANELIQKIPFGLFTRALSAASTYAVRPLLVGAYTANFEGDR